MVTCSYNVDAWLRCIYLSSDLNSTRDTANKHSLKLCASIVLLFLDGCSEWSGKADVADKPGKAEAKEAEADEAIEAEKANVVDNTNDTAKADGVADMANVIDKIVVANKVIEAE